MSKVVLTYACMRISNNLLTLILVSVLVLIFKLYFTHFGFYHIDLITFEEWSLKLIRYGFGSFYRVEHSIYPPGYLYILWVTGKIFYFLIANGVNISIETAFKLPVIITDFANGILIYFIAKRFTNSTQALIAGLVYQFNPVVFLNSTYWGQIDAVVCFFLLFGILSLSNSKYILLSAVFLGLGQTIKPIIILSLPLVAVFLIANKYSFKKILLYFAIFTSTVFLIYLPFSQGSIFTFFIIRNLSTVEEWPNATSNAFNLWAVVSLLKFADIRFVQDSQTLIGLSFRNWGLLLFSSIYISIISIFCLSLKKVKSKIAWLSFCLMLCYLSLALFLTRMHERHFYYGLTFACLLFPIFNKKYKALIIILLTLNALNVYYSYRSTTPPTFYLSNETIILLSLITIIIFFNLFVELFKRKNKFSH